MTRDGLGDTGWMDGWMDGWMVNVRGLDIIARGHGSVHGWSWFRWFGFAMMHRGVRQKGVGRSRWDEGWGV
jgi:hypothetical protein